MVLKQKIPDIYLQIFSYIKKRCFHNTITDKEIMECINRVVYRSSAARLRKIIYELEHEFRLIRCITPEAKTMRYKLIITKEVERQLARLQGQFPINFT